LTVISEDDLFNVIHFNGKKTLSLILRSTLLRELNALKLVSTISFHDTQLPLPVVHNKLPFPQSQGNLWLILR
jgi:hypothetical protein